MKLEKYTDFWRFKATWIQWKSNPPLSNKYTIRVLLTKVTSVTRSGDLLDFGQLFKAFGNN